VRRERIEPARLTGWLWSVEFHLDTTVASSRARAERYSTQGAPVFTDSVRRFGPRPVRLVAYRADLAPFIGRPYDLQDSSRWAFWVLDDRNRDLSIMLPAHGAFGRIHLVGRQQGDSLFGQWNEVGIWTPGRGHFVMRRVRPFKLYP
jgi:hypothetical protein